MPIKSEHETKIGIMVDGKLTPLQPIPGLSQGTIIDSNENLFCENEGGPECICVTMPLNDYTGAIHIQHNRNYRRFIRSIRRIFPAPSDKSNNWLRMHGYPIRRKGHDRKHY